jgi:hypothetical protein
VAILKRVVYKNLFYQQIFLVKSKPFRDFAANGGFHVDKSYDTLHKIFDAAMKIVESKPGKLYAACRC